MEEKQLEQKDCLSECKTLVDTFQNNKIICMNMFTCMNEYFKTLTSGTYCKELFLRCIKTSRLIDLLAIKGSYIECKTLLLLNTERYIQIIFFLTYPERVKSFFTSHSIENFDIKCKKAHLLNKKPLNSESMAKKIGLTPSETIDFLIYKDILFPFTDKIDITLTKQLLVDNNNLTINIIKRCNALIPKKCTEILNDLETLRKKLVL